LPWTSGFFDHVYIMWLIEHLPDSMPMLREARRVLRPGGTVTATETDYTTFKVLPNSVDWDYLAAAQFKYFQRYGNAEPGRQLGGLLRQAGFSDVRNVPVGFHFFHDGGDGLRRHVEYIGGFLEPAIPKLAGLGLDEARLRSGLKHLRSIPEARNGSMTTVVYRAQGQNAGADSS
jgi:SAM-dependent methyltransferase